MDQMKQLREVKNLKEINNLSNKFGHLCQDFMIVNIGPHHPSMHDVLKLIVTLDGEDVIDCEPILGCLNKGMEKTVEN
ncbi:NAD(P)H-quinone oxidoreductase subunit H [Spatholobus suberectus]|nr:NAD(P)H-quinone oxidoreductase subunit H [Spatholobus suberectus]